MSAWVKKIQYQIPYFIITALFLNYVANSLGSYDFTYFVLLFLATLTLIAATTAHYFFHRTTDEKQTAYFRLVQSALWLIWGALAIYYLQKDILWIKLTPESKPIAFERLQNVLQILYFTAFGIGIFCALFSLSLRTTRASVLTPIATMGGLILVLVSLLYWTHIRPSALDLTTLRRFSLSAEGKELLKGVEQAVKVTAFHPFFSENYREIEIILRSAANANPKITYTFIDPMREKSLADEKKVDRVGVILLESVDPTESDSQKRLKTHRFTIATNDDMKRLERELVMGIVQLTGKKRELFYTNGHDEKILSGAASDDTIEAFDTNLRALRYAMKPLTPAEGFPFKMPKADLVMSLGPRRDFSTQEKKILLDYFNSGGKLFLAVDPESAVDLDFLLKPANVRLQKQRVLSDFSMRPSRSILQTHSYRDHVITAPYIQQSHQKFLTVFPGAGTLEQSNVAPDFDVNFFLMSDAVSWIDVIPNGLRDEQREKIAQYNLAVAIQSKKHQGRLVVVADSDFLINRYIDIQMNKELSMRMVQWLLADEKMIGVVPDRLDDKRVDLSGRKGEIVFYFLVLIYPLLILGAGLLSVRSYRRRLVQAH